MEPIIEVRNLGKTYRLGEVGVTTLRDDLIRLWAWMKGSKNPFAVESNVLDASRHGDWVRAIEDITFDVNPGERVGIIGKNGAGKSTLLKILTRITSPTHGDAVMRGRMAALLEVGTGFHPEFTGRENIYMNGLLLGMSRDEVDDKLNDIVQFSGIERYLDTPVKRYSSGMRVRLGFAVAAHLEPEILIVDEVLAVGDAEFQQKAIGKMRSVSTKDNRTILFVSHNMNAIRNLCTRCLVIDEGKIVFDGAVQDAIEHYQSVVRSDTQTGWTQNGGENLLTLDDFSLLDERGKNASELYVYDTNIIRTSVSVEDPTLRGLQFVVTIRNMDDTILGVMRAVIPSSNTRNKGNNIEIKFHWKNTLSPGTYFLTMRIRQQNEPVSQIVGRKFTVLNVTRENKKLDEYGLFQIDYTTEYKLLPDPHKASQS